VLSLEFDGVLLTKKKYKKEKKKGKKILLNGLESSPHPICVMFFF